MLGIIIRDFVNAFLVLDMKSYRKIFIAIAVLFCLGGISFHSSAQGVQPKDEDDPFIVIIDPGHGGFDPGARGSYSTEKEIALDVGLKTGKLIDKIPGVKVIYTRTTDIIPGHKTNKHDGLHYRADFANKKKGNVFISIHCNAAANSSAKGTEVYVWALRKSDNKAKVLRQNKELEEKFGDPTEASGPLDAIYWNSVRHSYMKQSLSLAADVEDQFAKLHRINRSVKQRNEIGIWVLHATAMPSILIETGFITNREEEDYLNNHQDEIAESIFKAFVQYLSGIKGVSKKQLLSGVKVPKDQTKAYGNYHYKIQLFASSKKMDTNNWKFKKLDDAVERKAIKNKAGKRLYRYLLGNYSTYQKATKRLKRIKPMGYQGAFIVTYKGDKRVAF